MMSDEGTPEEWLDKARKKSAFRMLAIGGLLLLGGGVWGGMNWNYAVATSPVTYVRVVTVLVVTIGLGLFGAGLKTLLRKS